LEPGESSLEVMLNPYKYNLEIKYKSEIESGPDFIENMIGDYLTDSGYYPARWIALKLIEGESELVKQIVKSLPEIITNKRKEIINNIENSSGEDIYSLIAESRYDFIKNITRDIIIHDNEESVTSVSDKIDRIVTNKFLGIPIFLIIMFGIFAITFKLGDPLKGWIEVFFEWLSKIASAGLTNLGAPRLLISLITESIIGGLGSVLVFLPNIFYYFWQYLYLKIVDTWPELHM
jgi:ferrous iron transport protein B